MPLASALFQRITIEGADTLVGGDRLLVPDLAGLIQAAIMSSGFEAQADSTIAGQLSATALLLNNAPVGAPAFGRTGTINFLTTNAYTIDLPAVAGKRALAALSRIVVEARTGTATGTLTASVGTNAPTWDDMFPTLTSAAANFNTTAVPFSIGSLSAGGLPDVSSDNLSLNITGALGGASVLSGYFALAIWYVDL